MQEDRRKEFPFWLLTIGVLALYFAWRVWADEIYAQVITIVSKGIGITIFVTFVGFALATLLGLILALGVLSRHRILREFARFYIEVMRGIPILVILLYIAFVGVPGFVSGYNWLAETLGLEPIRTRDINFLWRAIIALMLAYAAFIAEVFRAGILAVDEGQVEAAKALGLSPWQRFRLIIFPQAVRTILPPLGNDFIAMTKDSSLVSVLGVADVTQLGKVYAAGSFRFFETYNIVAYIYLLMTLALSLALRRLEARLRARAEHPQGG